MGVPLVVLALRLSGELIGGFLRDANPHRMAIAIFFLFLVLGHSVRVGVPFVTGCQPSQNGRCHFLFPVSGVVPFCEGRHPFFYGTPTLAEWPVPFFLFFFSQLTFNISAVREIQNEVA